MAPRPKKGARAEAPAAPRAEAPAEHRQAPRGRGPKVRAPEAPLPKAAPAKAPPPKDAAETTALQAASPEPREARAPAEGGKRRGLGQLGLRAFQEAVPELTLLPRRDSFDAGDIEDLSGLGPAQLRKLTQALPELLRAQKGRYSRQQVEQILRAKRLLEQGLAPGEIRSRLQAAAVAPAPSPPRALAEARPPRPALPAAAPATAPGADGAALPTALLQQLRAELEALVALCAEDDEPAA